ncbi:hypothetical protein HMI54_012902 [Coelomomyces lativittatus]|nr:hypothetical protein HMI56_005552 [Coelomomyces lativittatus]KAJ1513751.1 hypothetical protein HMI55_005264 [Coelomomyces lativittatus]KAJ1515103.1 hypothetical protein HMI54_012902 [Coelomomyces lativittatus]
MYESSATRNSVSTTSHASRTQIIESVEAVPTNSTSNRSTTDSVPSTSSNSHSNSDSHSSTNDVILGALSLTGGPLSDRNVTWDETVVDNEFLNKKKSKLCCIFHKQRNFDDPDTDSESESDSESGSDSPEDEKEKDFSNDNSTKLPSTHRYKPNAYEIQPKYKKQHKCHHHKS